MSNTITIYDSWNIEDCSEDVEYSCKMGTFVDDVVRLYELFNLRFCRAVMTNEGEVLSLSMDIKNRMTYRLYNLVFKDAWFLAVHVDLVCKNARVIRVRDEAACCKLNEMILGVSF